MNNHKCAWKLVRDLRGKSSKPSVQLKRLENWLLHFQNLLGKKPTLPQNDTLPREVMSPPLNIPVTPFTIKELTTTLSDTKSCKAFGPDNIPPIIWKDQNFHSLLLRMCNIAFEDNVCPQHWLNSNIVPVLKMVI